MTTRLDPARRRRVRGTRFLFKPPPVKRASVPFGHVIAAAQQARPVYQALHSTTSNEKSDAPVEIEEPREKRHVRDSTHRRARVMRYRCRLFFTFLVVLYLSTIPDVSFHSSLFESKSPFDDVVSQKRKIKNKQRRKKESLFIFFFFLAFDSSTPNESS